MLELDKAQCWKLGRGCWAKPRISRSSVVLECATAFFGDRGSGEIMSRKKLGGKNDRSGDEGDVQGKPSFPYTTKPASLRKFLQGVPERPKPTKINADYLKGIGFKDTNDQTIIRVLKAVGLVNDGNNEPTSKFIAFMQHDSGPSALAVEVKRVYAALFEKSHHPHKEPDATLRNYFNIHSGGSSNTLALQIQTFKALCDYADFSSNGAAGGSGTPFPAGASIQSEQTKDLGGGALPQVHIDLHIHLPENKSSRDYEYILHDIAKYIYGRDIGAKRDGDG
jgi:Family of unknown function (DUF5343)